MKVFIEGEEVKRFFVTTRKVCLWLPPPPDAEVVIETDGGNRYTFYGNGADTEFVVESLR